MSLSENDANSPKQHNADQAALGTGQAGFDFAQQNEEDFFNPLDIPVQKRSLSNGDSFFPKSQAAGEEALQAENFTKFAATASDPDSSGL